MWSGGIVCDNAQRITIAFQSALSCHMGKQLVRVMLSLYASLRMSQRSGGFGVCRIALWPVQVGYKNVSILVATQSGFLNETTETLEAMCTRNNYGRVGELVSGGRIGSCRMPRSPLLSCCGSVLCWFARCLVGVQCLPCPQGAYCDGKLADPIALPGWYVKVCQGAGFVVQLLFEEAALRVFRVFGTQSQCAQCCLAGVV